MGVAFAAACVDWCLVWVRWTCAADAARIWPTMVAPRWDDLKLCLTECAILSVPFAQASVNAAPFSGEREEA